MSFHSHNGTFQEIAMQQASTYFKKREDFIKSMIQRHLKPEHQHHYKDGNLKNLSQEDKIFLRTNVELYTCTEDRSLKIRIYAKVYGDDGYMYHITLNGLKKTEQRW